MICICFLLIMCECIYIEQCLNLLVKKKQLKLFKNTDCCIKKFKFVYEKYFFCHCQLQETSS